MKYFQRQIEFTIPSLDLSITDLHMKFRVYKSIEPKKNSTSIEIINLDRDTRSLITRNMLVNLAAGYKYGQGLIHIGQGNISSVKHTKTGTEIITTIIINDGLAVMQNTGISLSFIEDVSVKQILETITAKLGLPIKGIEIDELSVKLGYSYYGKATSALDDICRQFNLNWSIQDGTIQIVTKGKPANQQMTLLTPQTGLIGDVESGNDSNVYRIKSLLQPQFAVGELVQVEDENVNGKFIVQKIEHIGNNKGGDFYTICEVFNYV